MNSKLIAILALSSLTVIFVAQNMTETEIGLILWSVSIPVSLLIILILLLGFLLGWSLHSYLDYRKSRDEYVYLE